MSASESREQIDHERNHFFLTPLGVLRHGGEWPAPVYRHVLAACARWESEGIVEWLVYHRSIGFDHVYLYCNDDDPAELYEAILPFVQGDRPFVTFYHYRYIGEQYQMYRHFMRHHLHESEWIMLLDIDEFVCLPGRDNIAMVSEELGDRFDAVYFNWCCYGDNGFASRPHGSVLRNYTRRERGVHPFTKILIRSREIPYSPLLLSEGVPFHHDLQPLAPHLRLGNILGEDMSDYYEDFPHKAEKFLADGVRGDLILQRGYIAHFSIRSKQDFQRRVDRGLYGEYTTQSIWGEQSEEDRKNFYARMNEVHDCYLQTYWDRLVTEGRKKAVFPAPGSTLVSLGKRATQSSTIHERSRDEDACDPLSGKLTGRPQNHSALEDSPWWMVDLGALFEIHYIQIFNRVDIALERLSVFRLDVSHDRFFWKTVIDKKDGDVFGGLDGTPFTWSAQKRCVGRYVRLTIPLPKSYLQMDQIEIYGEPLRLPVLRSASSNTLL